MNDENRRPEGRRTRLLLFGLMVVILLLAGFRLYATVTAPWWQGLGSNDLIHYELAVDRWLALGSPYDPREVAGAFDYGPTTFLHPPISLPFFLAFKVVPWPLFWIVPLLLFAGVSFSFRPAPWTWPLMALPLLLYPIGGMLISGNSDLWAWAFFAAGLRWGWPAALLAIKPSLATFMLIGAGSRSWWMAVGVLALASIPFGGLWIEWLHVVLNSPGSMLYSAGNVVMFAIPVIAQIGRTDSPDRDWRPLGHRLGRAVGREP